MKCSCCGGRTESKGIVGHKRKYRCTRCKKVVRIEIPENELELIHLRKKASFEKAPYCVLPEYDIRY